MSTQNQAPHDATTGVAKTTLTQVPQAVAGAERALSVGFRHPAARGGAPAGRSLKVLGLGAGYPHEEAGTFSPPQPSAVEEIKDCFHRRKGSKGFAPGVSNRKALKPYSTANA